MAAICPDLKARAEAELQQEKTAKHLQALSNAAAALRQVGDLATAQGLEERAHKLMKAENMWETRRACF